MEKEKDYKYDHRDKGKEFDDNNKLIFEGEYSAFGDKKNGKEIKYNDKGTPIAEIEYLNGQKKKKICFIF